eukprot:g16379.t1
MVNVLQVVRPSLHNGLDHNMMRRTGDSQFLRQASHSGIFGHFEGGRTGEEVQQFFEIFVQPHRPFRGYSAAFGTNYGPVLAGYFG